MEDAIKIIGTALQSISVIAAALFAIAGLDAWRRQMVGKRQMEVAEQMLSAAYRYRDAIRWIRNPGAYGTEGSSRPREQYEDEATATKLNTYFVPLERIQKEKDTLEETIQVTYLARVYYSQAVVDAFLQMKRALDQVTVSARMLLQVAGLGVEPKNQHKWEADIWEGAEEPDPLKKQIDGAIAVIEAECRPHLSNRKTPLFLRWLIGN